MAGFWKLVVGFAVFVSAVSGSADTASLAAKFGAREYFDSVAVSPDGSKVSYLTPFAGSGSKLIVVDTRTGDQKSLLSTDDITKRMTSCSWAKANRILCVLRREWEGAGMTFGSVSLIAVDGDGGSLTSLGPHRLIDMLPDNPTSVLAGDRYPYLLDLGTGREKSAGQYERATSMLMTDGFGNIRVKGVADVFITAGGRYSLREKYRYFYRATTSQPWSPLAVANLGATATYEVDGFDEKGVGLYALKPLNGRQALYHASLDGSGSERLVFAHPEVDVTGVARIGKHNRPIGAMFATDRQRIEYFDPEIKALSERMAKSVNDNGLVFFIDETWDGKKLLVFIGSDKDPGAYYLYDKSLRQLAKLSDVRPDMAGLKLSRMQPVTFRADDGNEVPAYLTLPPDGKSTGLPTIIMPHGGPSSRDHWGFDWQVQYFAQLGYAVLQPNFRGSAGYGEAWLQTNAFQSWKRAIADINDGARWLVRQGIADPARMAIVGWSYGGYAALQASVVDPRLYKATIAIAPLTDLELMRKRGRDYSDFNLFSASLGTLANLKEGSPAQRADAFRAPVLMFHGDKDLNVDIEQSRRMAAALKAKGKLHELIVYPGLQHSLIDSAARADMLLKSARFLEANLK
jgi:dienelactone hydrolase